MNETLLDLPRAESCFYHGDNTFGPAIPRECRAFDFTLLFEQSFMSLVPSILLILFSPIRILDLYRRDSKTIPHNLGAAKLVLSSCYAILQLILLIFWGLPSTERTNISLAAAVFSFVASLVICFLSRLEHTKSIQPSLLINVYLLFSMLFDAVQLRTLWMIPGLERLAGIFTASLTVKAGLMIIEAVEKGSLIDPSYRQIIRTPEALTGIYNRSVFWWLNSLFLTGFKKVLSFDDLYGLENQLSAERLHSNVKQEWQKADKSQKHVLIRTVFSAVKWQFLLPVLPRLALVGLHYSQPLLINRIIKYIESSSDAPGNGKNVGYGLIGAASLIYLGLAVVKGQYQHGINRSVAMVRGTLISLIYEKTIDINYTATDTAKPVTLMSADVDSILMYLPRFHEIWGNLIEVAIAIYLLEIQIGISCIVPLILSVVCTAANTFWVGKKMGPRRRIWNEAIQHRLGLTSSTLRDMKSLKMMGLTARLKVLLQNERLLEMRKMMGLRWMLICMNAVAQITGILSPAIILMVYSLQAQASGKPPLSSAQAYTVLSILTLMTGPMETVLNSIPGLMSSIACFDRIQQYLLSDGKQDDRMIEGSNRNAQPIGVGPRSSNVELQDLSRPAEPSKDIFVLEESSFGYDSENSAISSITARIPAQSFTMVIGEVGSGKSTFLLGLLGEIRALKGFLHFQGSDIGYCQQSAWLPNETVRNIIVGPGAYDDQWYQTCVHASALEVDIESFPNGDNSLIGSRGMTLSGGQRQRLALARALYARTPILLLDDIFSALDAKTEALVFQRLFSDSGLFRKHGTTVVLATHAVYHLRTADHIIALGKGGGVLEQGSFEELNSGDGYVKSLAVKDKVERQHEEQQEEPKAKESPKSTSKAKAKAGDIDDKTRRMGDISVYNYYRKQISWHYLLPFISLQMLQVLAISMPQLWVQWWTGAHGRNTDMYISVMIVLAVTGWGLEIAVLWAIFHILIPRTGQRLHWTLLTVILAAPLSYFAATDSGTILNRFSQDMTIVDLQLPTSLMMVLSSGLRILWNMGMMCYGSYYMVATVPFLAGAVYAIQNFYLRTSRQLRLFDLDMKSPLFTIFSETLEGIVTIRAFGWQQSFFNNMLIRLDRSQSPYYLLSCIQVWLGLSLDMLIAFLAILLVAFGTQFKNTTSGAAIGVALLNVLSFSRNLTELVRFWTQLETSIGSVARLKKLEEDVKPEDLPSENINPPKSWPGKGSIAYTNITASYEAGPNATPVLNDINLEIKAGEKIGICGRTGSGKSTLVSVLFRLLPTSSGTITVDDYDISTVPRSRVRGSVICIPQEPFLLSGSVRFNAAPHLVDYSTTEGQEPKVKPSSNISDREIISALETVNLWDEIAVRGGLSTNISALGLSHGQKQLFCLARALLRKNHPIIPEGYPDSGISSNPAESSFQSSILVLDEATASVDTHTDKVMRQIIASEFANFTVLTIAHRLSSLEDCDRIVVMDKGRIVEMGHPADLRNSQGSYWKQIWDTQH